MLTQRISILLLAVAVVLPATSGCFKVRDMAPNLNADAGTAAELRKAVEAGAGAVAGGGAAAVVPTGWANLTGSFTLNGTPPRRNALTVDKDTEVCAPGGVQILEQTLEVSEAGGIRNVLIYLVTDTPDGDPNWEHPSHLANKTATVEFDQKACIFLSHVMAMRSKQTMKIINSDPVLHNTNIQASGDVASANPSVPSNSSTLYKPDGQSDRPFPISCSVHPWMSAWMITRNSPYFAVTAEDGSFTIPNVPAGEGVELQFRVWQEKAGFVQGVTVNGAAETWSQGRFKVSLSPDETRKMEIVVDASEFN